MRFLLAADRYLVQRGRQHGFGWLERRWNRVSARCVSTKVAFDLHGVDLHDRRLYEISSLAKSRHEISMTALLIQRLAAGPGIASAWVNHAENYVHDEWLCGLRAQWSPRGNEPAGVVASDCEGAAGAYGNPGAQGSF